MDRTHPINQMEKFSVENEEQIDFENKLKTAYEEFKERVSEAELLRFQSFIKSVHENAWQVIEGKSDKLEYPEFAWALSTLEPELSNLPPLPKTKYGWIKLAIELRKLLEELPKVMGDGSIVGFGKWEQLDIGWAECVLSWLKNYHTPFITNPVHNTIPDKVSLCIAGDWGTGEWREDPKGPSQLVGEQIAKLKPDITLHLGDVYYAATQTEEQNNLINIWPSGSEGSYTLNSNHEMFDGPISYYDALNTHFTNQGGCSYFLLENSNWLFVGLDSAYHADRNDLYLTGNLGDDQINWLKGLPPKQGIIITSHHNGYELKGAEMMALYSQVMDALNGEDGKCRYQNVYWYWGHEHNAVAYKDRQANGATLKTRCIGHGALPYGIASELEGQPEVTWFETQSANDPDIPLRVLCGFAHIQLDGAKLTEAFIGEDGSVRWPQD
ncbi:hypothetical protein [Nisaea sp.]|uniref:metallophosphoesterase family protein n=1 Tax=Nisaea sp. TaxID=2024842 RepID=UPI0032973E55